MNIFRQWRRWIRPLVVAFYIVAVVLLMPFLVVEFQLNDVEKHLQAWFIGGVFVLLAIPISIWGIIQHLIHYTQPRLQRYIIRILWMVPIYATDAWLALRFKEAAIYLDTIRECYEAYVLYNFMAFLLQYLATEFDHLYDVLKEKPDVSHIFPMCFIPKWKNGRNLIMRCKHGVLQYTVVRPITTVIALITQFAHVFHEGKFTVNSAWLYLTVINSFSQGLAMYCLVLFYKATKEELKHLKPIPKFLCIKAIVFFLFWQQVVIAGFVAIGVIRDDNTKWPEFRAQDIATGLQDFIICIEMFLFSIAHYYSFSHKPYVDYALGHQNCCTSFREMLDVSDVRDDVVDHVRTVGVTATDVVTRPLRKKPTGSETEKTPLLNDSPQSSEASTSYHRLEDVTEQPQLNACTPPVHIEVDDYYHIQRNAQPTHNLDHIQQIEAQIGNIGAQQQLIDFASTSGEMSTDISIPSANMSSQYKTMSGISDDESIQTIDGSHTVTVSQQKGSHATGANTNTCYNTTTATLRPLPKTSTDDSVSTHTFESASDITDLSLGNRHGTESMYNYAVFSDSDAVSHNSQ